MDHFPLPKDPTFPFPRVPYVCGEVHECTDFLTYHTKFAAEWKVYVAGTINANSWLRKVAERNPDGVQLVEAFLQRWVFFGLLREVLAPANLFSMQDYIVTDAGCQYIHTRGLVQRLQTWVSVINTWSSHRRSALSDRIFCCFKEAVRGLISFYNNASDSNFRCSQAIKISLVGICEVISEHADFHLPHKLGHLMWHAYGAIDVFSDDSCIDHMLKNGWCRREIKVAQEKVTVSSAHHFIHRIQKPDTGLDHSSCTNDQCFQMQTNVEDYVPKHTIDTCSCSHLGLDPAAVAKCLDSGSFPLLRVVDKTGSHEDLTMEVVAYHEDSKYVAITHVWADGLGNPRASLLPRCQIRRLHDLRTKLNQQSFDWAPEGETDVRECKSELLLWIDSLCCPTVPSVEATDRDHALKRTAIEMLRSVYQNATYVLVLDRTLETTVSRDMTPLEIGVRWITSRWTGRLWTLQEGVLPKKLLIQFQDQVVDVRGLWGGFRERRARDAMQNTFLRDVIGQIVYMRAWHSLLPSETMHFMNLVHAVRQRRVTNSSDEAICLAVILKLDVAEIAAVAEDLRMPTLWRLLSTSESGVPPSIVFNGFPRLSVPGYRWAPATLLNSMSHRWRGSMDTTESARASLNLDGLVVRRAGWRVRGGVVPRGFEAMISNATLKTCVPTKHPDGRWFTVMIQKPINLDPEAKVWDVLQDHSKDWYFIRDQRSDKAATNQSLLVYAERKSARTVYRTVALTCWDPMDPNVAVLYQATSPRAKLLRRHSAVRMMQLIVLYERWFLKVFAMLPGTIQLLVRPVVVWWLRILAGPLLRRFMATTAKHTRMATQTPEVVRALHALYPADSNPDSAGLEAYVRNGIYGYEATILEDFEPTHEWCID